MIHKLSYIILLLIFMSFSASAKSNQDSTTLKGLILDELAEPVMGALIEIFQNNQSIGGAATDEDGNYSIKLKNGTYVVKTMYSGYKIDTSTVRLTGNEYKVCVQLQLKGTNCGDMVIHLDYKVPLIDYDAPNKKVYTSDEIEKMAH